MAVVILLALVLLNNVYCSIVIEKEDQTNITLTNSFKLKNEFTFCIRFDWYGIYRKTFLFSFKENIFNLVLRPDVKMGFVVVNKIGHIFSIPENMLKIYTWQNVCISFGKKKLNIFSNGDLWYEGTHHTEEFQITINETDFGFKRSDRSSDFIGKITQFNIWSKALSNSQIKELSDQCEYSEDLLPDILNWIDLKQHQFSGKTFKDDFDKICSNFKTVNRVIPFALNQKEAKHVCKILGAEISYPKSENFIGNL